MIINVKAKPSSKKEEVIIIDKNNFEVYLKEKAEKNKANIELIRLLSKYFNAPSRNVRILKGINSKQKIIDVKLT